MLFKKLYHLGDKVEDKVRGKLSHFPIIYAFVGGFGIVVFWRGVWHFMDFLIEYFFVANRDLENISLSGLPWWDGLASIAIGTFLLLLVGLFVSNFIGNEIIISGLKGEKKIAEKTAEEVREDVDFSVKIVNEAKEISRHLSDIEKKIEKK